MRSCEQVRSVAPIVMGIAALGWIALFWLDGITSGHDLLCHGRAAFHLFGAQPGGSRLAGGLFFLSGWILMTIAMMLPTILPLVELFHRMIRGRTDHPNLSALLICGYLSVWLIFGLFLLGLGTLTNSLSGALLGSRSNGRLLTSGLFVVAGVFQLLPVKRRCLDRCRSWLNLAGADWNELRPVWGSFLLGLRQGVACAGSCGALMLLMFAVETPHLPWMVILAAVMIGEKNMAWGPRLTKPLGILLLAGAALIFVPGF